MNIPIKIGFYYTSGFREEDWNVKAYRQQWVESNDTESNTGVVQDMEISDTRG